MNWSKAIFDRAAAAVGLILLLPVFAIISALILMAMGPPAFYVSERVGRHGRLFRMFKFRTMRLNADREPAGSVTVGGDRRVTRLGAFLRRYKLDELPELINILRGDMSFVGPRPDVPGFADELKGRDRSVLELKPGITGPATLKYANEEKLLASIPDPQRYNREVVFPDKVKINLQYLDEQSFFGDLKILWRTIFRGDY